MSVKPFFSPKGGSLYRYLPIGDADPLDTVQGLLESCTYRLGKETAHDGILQRFVEPREPRDFMVRAIWSPRSAIYEKRTNK